MTIRAIDKLDILHSQWLFHGNLIVCLKTQNPREFNMNSIQKFNIDFTNIEFLFELDLEKLFMTFKTHCCKVLLKHRNFSASNKPISLAQISFNSTKNDSIVKLKPPTLIFCFLFFS